jgi:RNA polymerase sigma-70 factor (ECF subfamily)|tara:strand:+ start:1925 stop:2446 length:522 start_codon:yes stop_codon:yes gene_type:complete
LEQLDKNRFKEVFKKYYNPLCNYASTIVKDHKMAQDVVQDVFTKLWDKRDNVSIDSNEKSYLFQAVKNRSLEILRKQKNDQKVSTADYKDLYVDGSEIDEQARKYMLKEFLYKSIRQLPPKCQEIFVMNKVNGLTYNEIALDLDISVKTVENHIGKAYRKLRELMEGRLSEMG